MSALDGSFCDAESRDGDREIAARDTSARYHAEKFDVATTRNPRLFSEVMRPPSGPEMP